MGFMAGFGPAFSDSFERGNERNAKRRDDLFKITYSDFIDRRKQKEEWEREDAKAARKAEALLENSGVDPRAYPHVYKQVQAGIDDTVILNDLRTGRFEFNDKETKTPEGVDPESEATPESDPMAAQMSESGMNPAAPAAPAAAPESPVPQENGFNLGKLFPKFRPGGRAERDRNRALEATAGAAGTTVEDVQGTLTGTGYTPPDIDTTGIKFTPVADPQKADPLATLTQSRVELDAALAAGDPQRIEVAKRRWHSVISASTIQAELDAKAEGITLDGAPATVYGADGTYKATVRVKRDPESPSGFVDITSGEPIEGNVVPRDKAENDLLESINTSLQKPMSEQTGRISAALGSVRTYNTMSDIVEKTEGAVLAPATSGLFKFSERWIQDATVAAEQANKMFATNGELPGDSSLEGLQAQLEALKQSPDQSLGTQKGLFEVQKAIMAYQLGAAMGQDGRSLAEAERKLFTEMAAGGVTVERFHQGMADILFGNIRTLDQQTKLILENDMNVKQYVQTYRHAPGHINIEPITSQLANSTDPELNGAWQRMQEFNRAAGMKLPQKTPGTPEETVTPAVAPAPGTRKAGKGGIVYEFKGGNPKDPNNWMKVE